MDLKQALPGESRVGIQSKVASAAITCVDSAGDTEVTLSGHLDRNMSLTISLGES